MRRKKGKHGSAQQSCNGKLQIISDKTWLQFRDGNLGCRVWRRGKMEGKREPGKGRIRPVSSCIASQ